MKRGLDPWKDGRSPRELKRSEYADEYDEGFIAGAIYFDSDRKRINKNPYSTESRLNP